MTYLPKCIKKLKNDRLLSQIFLKNSDNRQFTTPYATSVRLSCQPYYF